MDACRIRLVLIGGLSGQRTATLLEVPRRQIYRFFDCPVTVYNDFVAAASKGRYFSQQIRNHFRYKMVRRGSSGNRQYASPQPCLAEQLRASVVLAKARAVQQRDMSQAAGALE